MQKNELNPHTCMYHPFQIIIFIPVRSFEYPAMLGFFFISNLKKYVIKANKKKKLISIYKKEKKKKSTH